MSSSNPADLKAHLADAQAIAAAVPIVSLLGALPDTPDGYVVWAVGPLGGPRSRVLMPEFSPDAPPVVMDRLVARVLADATGTCPLCGAVAGLVGPEPPNPERPLLGRGVYYALPVSVGFRHEGECPAVFGEEDRRWFPSL